MAEESIPFWRKIAEAVGLSEPELTVQPALPPPAHRGARKTPPAAPAGPAVPTAPAAASATPAVGPDSTAQTGDREAERQPMPAQDAEALLELWFAREADVDASWGHCVPGPGVDEIATRLSLVPPAFLADSVAILPLAEHILDVEYGSPARSADAVRARQVLATVEQVRASGSSAARRGAALVLWLWASDDLHGPLSVPLNAAWPDRAVAALAFRLAAVIDPAAWISDADRREEAARQFLFWSGNVPAGEDEATARSILAMRDSLQQNAALAQTLVDHEHRLEVSRRLREAQAREAAARYSSE